MGERRQSATYFTFKGGLNTEASDLNAAPEDARILKNVKITEKGTVRQRKGIDFLPALNSDNLYMADSTDLSEYAGTYVEPAPAATDLRIIKDDGTAFRIWILHIGQYVYIYNQETLPILYNIASYRQRIQFPNELNKKYQHVKSMFVSDGKRVYVLNPYLPLLYLKYIESDDAFAFYSESIRIRDLTNTIKGDDRVTHNDYTYRAILTHQPVAENEPGEGTNWKDVWVLEGKAPAADAPDAWALADGQYVSVPSTVWQMDGEGFLTQVTTWTDYECVVTHTSTLVNKPPNVDYWRAVQSRIGQTIDGVGIVYSDDVINRNQKYPLWAEGQAYNQIDPDQEYYSNVKQVEWFGNDGLPSGYACGSMAGGRLWLANPTGNPNTIYFSQSIEDERNYYSMYTFADPRNPDDPDVVDTDGGVIKIPAINEIVGVADYKGGILILATNGIWFISGADNYFKATSYSINKITDDGCLSRFGWTYVEDSIVYAGSGGIYAITLDQVSAKPTIVSISDKIKSYWTSIPRFQRQSVDVSYNSDTFQLIFGLNIDTPSWFYTLNKYTQPIKYRDFLIFDTKMQAWYTYELTADPSGASVSISSMAPFAVNLLQTEEVTVLGEVVIVDGDIVYTAPTQSDNQVYTGLVFVKRNGNSVDWSFGIMEADTLVDFNKSSADAETNIGIIETVPQLFSDIGHQKQLPYLHTAFERVEDGFDSETRTYTNPGSCNARVIWNWATDESAGKDFGPAYQAYKPNRYNMVYENGQLIGQRVVMSKHRIRGFGQALAYRFEGDAGYDFHLLGWQSDLYVNPRT